MSSLGDFPTLHAPGADVKIKDIYKDFTAEALEQLRNYFTVNPIPVPIGQVQGFSRFTAQIAPTIAASETRTSTTYGDLTTVGPQLTGLADGSYIFFFGAWVKNSGGTSIMSLKINSTEAVDTDGAIAEATTRTAIMRGVPKTLSGGNNTATVRYVVTAGTGTFQNRWMFALRYANA